MKIENSININRVEGVAKKGKVTNGSHSVTSSEGAKGDNTKVSGGAQILAKAMESYKDIPEIREEQIEAIRAQILNGQYPIRFDELAKKLAANNFWD